MLSQTILKLQLSISTKILHVYRTSTFETVTAVPCYCWGGPNTSLPILCPSFCPSSPHVLAFPTRNGQSNMRHWRQRFHHCDEVQHVWTLGVAWLADDRGSTTVMKCSKSEPWVLLGCSTTVWCSMYLPLCVRCNIPIERSTFDPGVTCFLDCTVQNIWLGLRPECWWHG
jgi:hypothetical protein